MPEPVAGAVWVPLSAGFFSLVDEVDYQKVNEWNWSTKISGHGQGKKFRYGHRIDTIHGYTTLHRFILGVSEECDIDHINGDTLDNRRQNLRLASRSQNLQNQVKTRGHSRFKGVYFDTASSKWKAQITIGGIRKNLGRFADEELAAVAYNNAAIDAYGAFACINGEVSLAGSR